MSNWANVKRIARSCCRRGCWSCCAPGGAKPDRKAGCFPLPGRRLRSNLPRGGQPKINPISPRQPNRAFTSAKHVAGVTKPATLHTLRHTHLLEANTDVRVIQVPFGPEAVLAYLSRYTHRVALSNHRIVSADADTVAFRWKDYRIKQGDRQKIMRLATPEFIRRFLIHVLLASSTRKANITKIRALICVQRPEQATKPEPDEIIPLTLREPCPCCGGPMRIIEIFRRGQKPMSRAPPQEQTA